jgi:uncharacterized protein
MIRDAAAADFPAILALNAESERFLSAMDMARLRHIDAQAVYHRVVELDSMVAGFLLALREGADYDSPNYRWFAARYGEFLYIDRIVISPACRGRRLGANLYDDLFAFARQQNVAAITCEFDVDPPNGESRRFHQKFGFREVGTQWVAGGKKQVSLQQASPRQVPPG